MDADCAPVDNPTTATTIRADFNVDKARVERKLKRIIQNLNAKLKQRANERTLELATHRPHSAVMNQ